MREFAEHEQPATHREWRKAVRQEARGETRRRARRRKGQTLIIFALSFTVLLGVAGLAIDGARLFDMYARMQRAAEAGALAGVLYMPNNYSSPLPPPGDGNSAVSRALEETIKNGFGSPLPPNVSDCPTPTKSVQVAVCTVPNRSTDLQVIVTMTVNVVLLSGLGVAPVTLQAVAQAEYLPPFDVGRNE